MFLVKKYSQRDDVINARKYSHAVCIARLIVYGLLFCMFVVGGSGCATGSAQDKSESARTAGGHAEHLYQAILRAYADRNLKVDIASEELLLVSSRYEKLGPDLRRRYISRVLALKAGIALNVTAEYQRGRRVDGEQEWKLIDEGDALKKQAVREEVELGRAIERAFHK